MTVNDTPHDSWSPPRAIEVRPGRVMRVNFRNPHVHRKQSHPRALLLFSVACAAVLLVCGIIFMIAG